MSRSDDADRLFWMSIGGIAPIFVAMALVPLRDTVRNANIALVLVGVVVTIAVAGGREAGAVAAALSAVSFDFFHTQPYQHLTIASRDDVETTILLLAVGLVVGHVASRGRRARRNAEARRGEVRRIYRVAEQVAKGDDPTDVIMAAQAELTALLQLRECRFEASPFTRALERLERSGVVSWHHHLGDGGFEIPADGVELPVLGRGQLLGRFVLDPTRGSALSLEQRVVAVAIADQVGAVLAAPRPGRENQYG